MTEPNEQESALMPCPFCGESKVRRNGNEYQIWCINDSCKGAHFIDAETWQNAWAHKQIAEKDRRIKELEVIKSRALDNCDAFEKQRDEAEAKIEQLEQLASKLAGALEELELCDLTFTQRKTLSEWRSFNEGK